MVTELAQFLPQIIKVVRAHSARRVWVFGSATGRGTKPFTPESDLDLLIEFGELNATSRGLNHPLFQLPELLELIVGRSVQLTENVPFEKPYFRENFPSNRELSYDSEHEKSPVGHSSIG